MEKEGKAINACEGKVFTISLQSMVGSTGYGWTLSSLPKGVAFINKEITPTAPGIAPVNEVFYFCPLRDAAQGPQKIEFTKICLYDPHQSIRYGVTPEKVSVSIMVIPANEDGMDDFVEYSEGQASYNMAIPYGYVGDAGCTAGEKYGYPCYENAVLKYGYSCGAESFVSHKYGYPCYENAVLKYGYPCGVAASAGKCGCGGDENCLEAYGYPPIVKYGYPGLKYGYPCYESPGAVKYGYPCCADIPLEKYGYPCIVKYGYPGCV